MRNVSTDMGCDYQRSLYDPTKHHGCEKSLAIGVGLDAKYIPDCNPDFFRMSVQDFKVIPEAATGGVL